MLIFPLLYSFFVLIFTISTFFSTLYTRLRMSHVGWWIMKYLMTMCAFKRQRHLFRHIWFFVDITRRFCATVYPFAVRDVHPKSPFVEKSGTNTTLLAVALHYAKGKVACFVVLTVIK
jgi:hypothetical protein